jgi:SEC-C motif domain protein
MSSVFGGERALVPCPCGSGVPYDRCCGALHRGEAVASSAERLMRSRYSAHARRLEDYLLATWHPATRPTSLSLDPSVEWLRLTVLRSSGGQEGDRDGEVEFTAHYREHGRAARLHERSRFTRRGGRWLYLEGTVG